MSGPSAFISYSWSSSDHEAWVVRLATMLTENGVNVVIDKWDLKEGHDKYAYMEKMVSDPGITKVIMICDKTYCEKANARKGGVGTETQIISREVYEEQDQNKFVAVITERDEEGKECVPAYYKSRIYIDLSEQGALYADNFEQLLRWIYDKPLYQRPKLGKPPAFLSGDAITLGTTTLMQRAVQALQEQKGSATGALTDFLERFTENLEAFRITNDGDVAFDEKVVESVTAFLPYRDEFIKVATTVAKYNSSPENTAQLHAFLERLIPYCERPEAATRWHEWNSDNFRFVAHELFLYCFSIFLRYDRFDAAASFVDTIYYWPARRDGGTTFTVFRQVPRSLRHRNERLTLRRSSLVADLLQERNRGASLDFRYLMQGDFVLFLNAELRRTGANVPYAWWPDTLLYADEMRSPFEIFVRARSAAYFARLRVALYRQAPQNLKDLCSAFANGERRVPSWDFHSIDPAHLMNVEALASAP